VEAPQLGQAADGRIKEAMAPAGQLAGSLEEGEQISVDGEWAASGEPPVESRQRPGSPRIPVGLGAPEQALDGAPRLLCRCVLDLRQSHLHQGAHGEELELVDRCGPGTAGRQDQRAQQ
jgi:hypothetical protein